MGLETGTYIDSLNSSNPVTATDQVSVGAAHLRLIKSTILATFPNVDGAVNFTPTEANYIVGVTSAIQTQIDGKAASSHNHNASAINAGTLADARVAESNVTQHEAALTVTESQISDLGTYIESGDSPSFVDLTLTGSSADLGSASLSTDNDSADEVGFKGAPQNIQNGDYTLLLTDAGKQIYKASGGAGETITIPANASVAFPIGTIIEIINDGGGNLSVAITTDTLEPFGGTAGTQTLGDNHKAVIEKVTSTLWKYSSTD